MTDSKKPWGRRDAQPYEVGNLAALRHGAYSDRTIAERAEQVHAQLLDVAPWLDQPWMAPALDRYLRACAREQLAHDGIEKAAAEKGPDKIPTRLLEAATAATRLAATLAADLGLSPFGHARLRAVAGAAATTEHTLEQLAEEGRAIRERRELEDGR